MTNFRVSTPLCLSHLFEQPDPELTVQYIPERAMRYIAVISKAAQFAAAKCAIPASFLIADALATSGLGAYKVYPCGEKSSLPGDPSAKVHTVLLFCRIPGEELALQSHFENLSIDLLKLYAGASRHCDDATAFVRAICSLGFKGSYWHYPESAETLIELISTFKLTMWDRRHRHESTHLQTTTRRHSHPVRAVRSSTPGSLKRQRSAFANRLD